MLFGQSMFNLSGATNVLLFLIIRPQLLLFSLPENSAEPEIQMPHLNRAPSPDIVRHDHQPGAMRMELERNSETALEPSFDSSRDSEAPSRIVPTRGLGSDEI